jgi:hypothetical protein
MNIFNFVVASIFLVSLSKMTQGAVRTIMDIDEMRLSNTTENSFGNFTEMKFKKLNRTHYALSGFFGVRKDIFQETGFLVIDFLQGLQQKLY